MVDLESLLTRWQSAGVLDAAGAERIRAWESEQEHPAGLRWQGMVALILGAILLASGIILFVSAHWDELGPGVRFTLALAMVGIFHTAGAATRKGFPAMATALHAVGTAATGASIALVGQTFNIQEHWPAAVLLWALAALAGWILLRDEAQQTLALILIPAWLFCELVSSTGHHLGHDVYLGRFLFAWAILYLTVFLDSRQEAVQGILFAAGAIASIIGVTFMLESWFVGGTQTALPLHVQIWAWILFALLPLAGSLRRPVQSLLPVCGAIVLAILLPWCNRTWVTEIAVAHGRTLPVAQSQPTILAHVLVAAFSVFLIWWGVRRVSRALVNFGIVGFALTVIWFFFSNIFDKVDRSLGLIGMGVLFLAGGWALERMRRRLIAAISPAAEPGETAR